MNNENPGGVTHIQRLQNGNELNGNPVEPIRSQPIAPQTPRPCQSRRALRFDRESILRQKRKHFPVHPKLGPTSNCDGFYQFFA